MSQPNVFMIFEHPKLGPITVWFAKLVEKNTHILKDDIEFYFPEWKEDPYFLAFCKPMPFDRIIARKDNGVYVMANKNKFEQIRKPQTKRKTNGITD